jgi:hypothetical protein
MVVDFDLSLLYCLELCGLCLVKGILLEKKKLMWVKNV